MNTYSQIGQDLWVLSLFPEGYKGTFVDIGSGHPTEINNTMLLELKGWKGISIDKYPFNELWYKKAIRKQPFIWGDALLYDYKSLFKSYGLYKPIDYLSIDIEGEGNRFKALQRVMESKYVFKVMTIEHDVYCGFDLTERQPQRKLLNDLGYVLCKPDVEFGGNAFEDWWINPKYIRV